jgi:hypothetical protein
LKQKASENADLAAAMTSYLEEVKRRLLRAERKASVPGRSSSVRLLQSGLRQRLDEAEHTHAWERLTALHREIWRRQEGLDEVMALFNVPPTWRNRMHETLIWRPDNKGLQNWFRRTGVYLACLNGKKVNPSRVALNLINSTVQHSTQETVTYLALLDGAAFAKDLIDFGSFQILRPSPSELETLLEVETNRVFFPRSISSADAFTGVWYLSAKAIARRPCAAPERIEESSSVNNDRDNIDDGALHPKFSALPSALNQALQILLLWPRWRWAQNKSDPDM